MDSLGNVMGENSTLTNRPLHLSLLEATMDGELLDYNNKRKMKENKLFTQEAVNSALKICVLGSLGLADPKKLAEDLTSLPEDLGKLVLASIMAGHMTLGLTRASKSEASKSEDNLEQEVLEAIKKS